MNFVHVYDDRNVSFLLDHAEVLHNVKDGEDRERVEHVEDESEFGLVEPVPE